MSRATANCCRRRYSLRSITPVWSQLSSRYIRKAIGIGIMDACSTRTSDCPSKSDALTARARSGRPLPMAPSERGTSYPHAIPANVTFAQSVKAWAIAATTGLKTRSNCSRVAIIARPDSPVACPRLTWFHPEAFSNACRSSASASLTSAPTENPLTGWMESDMLPAPRTSIMEVTPPMNVSVAIALGRVRNRPPALTRMFSTHLESSALTRI